MARSESVKHPRVLMLTQYLGIGGLERMIYSLSLALKRSTNWEPYVFAYDQSYQDTMDAYMDDAFREQGIPIAGCRKAPGFSWKAVCEIARFIRENQIEVIHSHDLGALIYGALVKVKLLGRVRLVHTQHSFVHLDRNPRYRHYEKWFTKLADRLIVVSPDTKAKYEELGLAPQRLEVVANGVEFPEHAETDRAKRIEKRKSLLQRMGLPAELEARLRDALSEEWLLYLARIHEGKGQTQVLEVWNRLPDALRARSVLLFVGPETLPGYLAQVQEAVKRSKTPERILLVGPTFDPKSWMEASDVFLSSSVFEGMPLAPNEAAGCGLPVFLSDIPGHESLRGSAFHYSLENPEQGAKLLETILKRVECEPEAFSAEIWGKTQWIRDRLSTRTMAETYARAYAAPG